MEYFQAGLGPLPSYEGKLFFRFCGSKICPAWVPHLTSLCKRKATKRWDWYLMLCQGRKRLQSILCWPVGSSLTCRSDFTIPPQVLRPRSSYALSLGARYWPFSCTSVGIHLGLRSRSG